MVFSDDKGRNKGQSSSVISSRRRQHQLRLLNPASSKEKNSETLWLCLALPKLAVDVVAPRVSTPVVVTENKSNRVLIYAANESAEQNGIADGQTLSSALALVNDLAVYQRDEKKEQLALNKLAQFAYQHFSSTVSLDYSNSLVVEVGRSRQLWQRLEQIKEVLDEYLLAENLSANYAWAPTARAAYWLAYAGYSQPVLSKASLAQAVFDIELNDIVTPAQLKTFHHSGIKTFGDVLRLPRDGLARRGGRLLLLQLDEAMGRCAEVVKRWYPLPYFLEDFELGLPSSDLSVLRPVVESLCLSLSHYLQQRQVMTRRVQIRFLHKRESASVMTLGFNRVVSKPEDLLRLFDAQCGQFTLKKEVLVIELCCRQFQIVDRESDDFFDSQADGKESWAQLEELFHARLGEEYFQPLVNSRDHRPEYAMAASACATDKKNTLIRPLWLLAKAQRLNEIHQAPYWYGQLYLEDSFERIEQGWWQGDDIRRDYFVAKTDTGAKVWVYRDLRQGQWFLHGVFG